jgi:hypothetical protein
LGGKFPPLFWPTQRLGGGAKAAPHAYIRGRGGLGRSTSSPQALAAPLSLLLLPAQAWRSPAGISPPPPPPRRRAAGIPWRSTTPPLPAGTGRGRGFIDTVRATEYGSAAGLQHRGRSSTPTTRSNLVGFGNLRGLVSYQSRCSDLVD